MDQKDRDLILEFKKLLPSAAMTHIKRVAAFGSRVRSRGEDDSDLDLLILVDTKTPDLENTIDDAAYQIMWNHDFKPIISIKVITEDSFHRRLGEGYSFYQHIEREGVSL